MAEEIKIPVSIDLTSLRAGLNELKAGIDTARADITKSLSSLSVKVDGKAAASELKNLSSTFEQLKSASGSSMNEQKSALATLVLSGQQGSKAYKDLVASIQATTKEANALDAAVKQVEKDVSGVGKVSGIETLKNQFREGREAAGAGGGMFGDLANKAGQLLSPIGLVTAAIGGVTVGISSAISSGREFETSLQAVSAVTGLTGGDLNDLGEKAKELSSKFGGTATDQLKSFQGVLSKFGADLAKTPNELAKVSENINLLAKAGGLNAAEAMDTLANSMLQFGVNVSDGEEAARESSRFINVLAASARVGAAEIPQVGQAVLVAGVAASQAKVSFEQTNAAIQVLAAGGKLGAEAGTALRNVLGKMAGEDVVPKDTMKKLKELGVDFSVVSNTSLDLDQRLAELGKAMNDQTAIAKLFGTENASAASILIKGATEIGTDGKNKLKSWTEGMTDTQDATTQAAINMNTLSERISVLKATIENTLIGAFQKVAPAISFLIDNLGTIVKVMAPILAAWATMAVLSQGYAAGVAVITAIKAVYATITGTATVATTIFGVALNTATGGLLLVVGAVVGLIAAYVLFSKTSEEAAQSQLEQAEAGKKVIETQIKENEAQQKTQQSTKQLAAEFEVLANKKNRTKEETERLKKIQGDLDKQYPSLIDQTKDFGANLDGVRKIGSETTNALTKLKDENDKLAKSLVESTNQIAYAQRNVAIGALQDSIGEIAGFFSGPVAVQVESTLQRFNLAGRLYAAKSVEDVGKIRDAWLETLNPINATGKLSSEQFLKISSSAQAAFDKTIAAIKTASNEIKKESEAPTAPTAPPPPKPPDDKDKDKGKTVDDLVGEERRAQERLGALKRQSQEQQLQDELARGKANIANQYIDKVRAIQNEELALQDKVKKGEADAARFAAIQKINAEAIEALNKESATKQEEFETKFNETKNKKIAEQEKAAREFISAEKIKAIKDDAERELQTTLASIEQTKQERLEKFKGEGEALANARAQAEQTAAIEAAKAWDEYNKKAKSKSTDFVGQITDLYTKAFSNLKINIAPSAEEIQKFEEAQKAIKDVQDAEDELDVSRMLAIDSLESLGAKQVQLAEQRAEAEREAANSSIDAWSRVVRTVNESLILSAQTSKQEAAASLQGLNDKRKASAQYDADITELRKKQTTGVQLSEAETRKLASAEKEQGEQSKDIAKANEQAQAQVAASAVSAGIAVLAAGGSVKDALKESAKEAVLGLIEMYRWSIYALVQSVVPPPFGIVAGEAAVQLLKAGASAAIGSFEVGGFTSDVGTKTVAGVVHGGEYVANANVTKRERALFEHFEKGGTSESYMMARLSGLRGFETGGFVGSATGGGDVKVLGLTISYADGLKTVDDALNKIYKTQIAGLAGIKDFSESTGVTIKNVYAGIKDATSAILSEQGAASVATASNAIEDYKNQLSAYNDLTEAKRQGLLSEAELAKADEDLTKKRGEVYTSVANGIAQQAAGLLIAGNNITEAFKSVNATVSGLLASQAEQSVQNIQANKDSMTQVALKSLELEQLKNEGKISAEAQAEQQVELTAQQTKLQGEQLNNLATQGVAQFATLMAAGANAGDALKQTAGALATSLLDIYTPQIVAMFASFIPPPFGVVAGTVAVQGLKALLNKSLSSFDTGGFTADVAENQVAGVVHGREFVANASTTKRERGLFEFMQAGGTSHEYFTRNYLPSVLEANKISTRINKVMPNDNGLIIAELRELRAAVRNQRTRVENYSNVNIDLDSKAISRKIVNANNYNVRRM
jgi:TP901 family phage tail tape measure protein